MFSLDRVPLVLTRSVPADPTRSVPADLARSVPADLARSVPADLARSVPADLARLVPAMLLDRFEQTFARSVPTKILDRFRSDTLSKRKGKAVVNEAVTLHPIDPELLKIDVAPLAPKLQNNRTAHNDYLKYTQEETATLREKVENERLHNPPNTSLDYALKNNKKIRFTEQIHSSGNTPIKQHLPQTAKKNKLEDHPRIVRPSLHNKKSVVSTKAISSVPNSKFNVNSDLKCAACNGCLFSDNHDSCVLEFINSVNARVKSKSAKKPVVHIVLWYLDSRCSKHMTGDRSQLINSVHKFLGTVKFGNDHVAKIMGRTRRIVETIHVDFDELTAMASEPSSSGPAHNEMTPTTISSGLVQKPSSSTPYVPPSRNDWDFLFQPMFDELLNPPPSVDLQAPKVIASIADVIPPVQAESTGSPSLTKVDQDATSPMEPKMYKDALAQSCWIEAMQEELNELNDLGEEVYVSQPNGFVDQENPNHVYKLKKALYGLKQAPHAWYDLLSSFLISQDFFKVDTPMVEKSKLDEDKKVKAVDSSHYRGMIGTLLYLTASRTDLQFAICMCARYQARPTEKHIHAHLKMRITLVAKIYAAVHLMRSQLTDYGLGFNKIPMYCDNKSAIALCCNNVQHSRSKHIYIKYHFIKEEVENGVIELYFVNTEYQLVDLFTKALVNVRITNAKKFDGLRAIGYATEGKFTRTKFLMYPRFLQIILDTETMDTTPYPAPLVTKKFFANMRHYQGLDMPLLAHMLNQGEPALVQAQPQEVSPPLRSPVVEPHLSTDPMPSPTRQSSPPPIPFGSAPSSGIASTDPIPDIPSSSRPSEPVLETITSPIRDDDTGGGSFPERPPSPSPRIATLEAKLKATKLLHRDAMSQELEALLDLANAALHKPSHSSTLSKPVYPDQSSEQEISPTSIDVVLTLSQSKTRARAANIIYKRLKKQQSSYGLDFTDAAIPAVGRVSAVGADHAVVTLAGGVDPADVVVSAGNADPAVVISDGGVDSASTFISAGILVAVVPSVPAAPSSPIRDPAKGKAIATPSSPITAPSDKELAYQ
nr:hypothetical protein [Tanacetum cinerariifolium]